MVKDVIDDVRLNIEGDYDDVSDRIEIERISSEPIEVEIDGIDIFENKDFDVVKFNVKKSYILQNYMMSYQLFLTQTSLKTLHHI
jgi:hypothetical protein